MKLDPVFNDNMVLAANKTILVYGTGKGTAQIDFAGQTKTVEAREEAWCVEFPPMPYGGPYELTFGAEGEKACLRNIYIGEVYLCAGQSNMELKLKETVTPKELYLADERLRLFSTDRVEEGDQFGRKDGWVIAREETIPDWTALGYLAGSLRAKNKDIAVGLIACYQGASSIESWLPEGAYQRIGIDLAQEEKHPGYFYKEHKEPYSWHYAASLYNAQLTQVFPFPLSAVLWYQGEANAAPKEGPTYLKSLTELIRVCRENFNDSALPFVVVQISDYKWSTGAGWKAVQDAQEEAQQVIPYVKTVISRDICESNDIHPKTKEPLARRMVTALEALLD